jgi:ribosomal protein S18 acetylase RimI-like enzyme
VSAAVPPGADRSGTDPSGGDSPGGGRIVVRPVAPDEHAIAGEIVASAYLDYPEVATDAAYLAELRDVAGRAAVVPVLVAVDVPTGTVLGTVTYVPGPGPLAESEGPDEAGIRMLAVAPEARGRGAGRRLVEACLERARRDGRRRVVLYTLPEMTAAHGLYRDLGFEREPAADWEYEPGKRLLSFALEL